jgi:flavin-dependent dehydrogenase
LVIGCDGIPSVVRRSVGAKPFASHQIAYAMRAIYDDVRLTHPGALTLIWNRDVLPAYGWVFPLPNGKANVGIGIRMDQLRARGETLATVYERFLELPRVREALRHASPVGPARGHALPMTTRPGAFVFDRAMLAGDAAGFVNPLTGEGIEYALESGNLAGRVAVQAAQLGDFSAKVLLPYAWACADQFKRVLDLNGRLRCAFSVPWLVDRLFRAGNRSSRLREDLARITLGGQGAKVTGRIVWGALAG